MKILLTFTGFHGPYPLGLVGEEEQSGPILFLVGLCHLTRSFSCQNPQQRSIKGEDKQVVALKDGQIAKDGNW